MPWYSSLVDIHPLTMQIGIPVGIKARLLCQCEFPQVGAAIQRLGLCHSTSVGFVDPPLTILLTTVHRDDFAGDVRRSDQEKSRFGHVFGGSPALQQSPLGDAFLLHFTVTWGR